MSPKYLVAAIIAAAIAAPLPAQSVKAGIEAWQRADYSSAVSIWRPLAEGGDADAQFNLGQAYRLGRGVPLDLGVARTWFERAARSGHLDAETTLGLLTFQNGDKAAGLKWLKQAAEEGEPRALLVYGTALYNGDGLPQDRVLGYAYVSRSAAQGLEPAQATLAQLNQMMPLAERQKGLAIALTKAKKAPPPTSSKPKPSVKVANVKLPSPKPVETAKAKSATGLPPGVSPPSPVFIPGSSGGGWRVQLGAFSQRASAEALYKKLSGFFPGHQPFYVAAGPVTRLQVGSYPSRDVAAKMCTIMASHGQTCFPVAAR